MKEKMCANCKEIKKASSFSRLNTGNLHAYCKICSAARARQAREMQKDTKPKVTIAEVLAWREEMKARIARGEI